MFILFNLIILGLVGIIAYWWANQGLFSAILHLVCVIIAGAIAFAVWEPLTIALLPRVGGFGPYLWGVCLIGVFTVALLVLRVVFDKLVPGNVDLPHWANLAFGFPVGLIAGVLTIGIYLIGAGHVQSTNKIMGYYGWGRSAQNARVQKLRPLLQPPIHEITYNFYSLLSVTSLRPSAPMRQYAPALHQQASLLRDAFRQGPRCGQLSLAPDAASVEAAYFAPEINKVAVRVRFNSKAIDFGEQFTMSASQVRLIMAPASPTAAPLVVHPDRWRQKTKDSGSQLVTFRFDDVTHYVTSVGGQESADVLLEFSLPSADREPRFLQIKGTRYRLSRIERITGAQYEMQFESDRIGALLEGTQPAIDAAGGGREVRGGAIQGEDILLSNGINPVSTSSNRLQGMEEIDKFLTQGEQTFVGGERPAAGLRIRGIYEPEGTKCIQVNVSRGSTADIYRHRDSLDLEAEMALVDSNGNSYTPIGFIHIRADGTRILLNPTGRVRTMSELPVLPTSGNQQLRLVFRVTEGVTIQRFQVGEQVIGTCNLLAKK
jgi:hypothetical protein